MSGAGERRSDDTTAAADAAAAAASSEQLRQEQQEAQQKALDSLNLILPASYADKQQQDDGAYSGYRTLLQLQADTADFRRKYISWRMQKPRGAKGETHDAVMGRTAAAEAAVRDLRPLQQQFQPPQQQLTLQKLDDTADAQVEAADPSWLRFYFHPFTSADAGHKDPLPLRNETVDQLGSLLQVPRYPRDPASVDSWIIHLGVGQFHRSHQLVYLDDYLQAQQHLVGKARGDRWASCGVGLMPWDRKMCEALRSQDLLFTVLSRANATSQARVVGSMFEYIFAPDETEAAYKKLLQPNLRIVSLTVTEKGYCQAVGGGLDLRNSSVQHDLELLAASPEDFPAATPHTAIGFLLLGLRERRRRGLPAFTVLSCDNLPENGSTAKRVVVDMAARLGDSGLTDHVKNEVAFPSTMVDRITPATSNDHINVLARDFGVADLWPVVTEEFRQWVIEDRFPAGRPAWESVGALLVSDVRPFELMKLRLLNGAHSLLAYVAFQCGYRFVDDAMNDLHISSFIRGYMDEVTSTVKNVNVELERYKEKLAERFGNRMIKDTVLRLAEDGSEKFYNTTKEALEELLAEKRHTHFVAMGFASFIHFLANADPTIIKESRKDLLIAQARACLEDVRNTAAARQFVESVYGTHIAQSAEFSNQVTLALFAFEKHGARAVLARGGVLQALLHSHLHSTSRLQQLLDFSSSSSCSTL